MANKSQGKSQVSQGGDFLPQQNDVLPSASTTARRSERQSPAGELGLAAETLTWSRKPEIKEYDAMAEVIAAEGFYDMADLADASAAERTQLAKRLAETKAGRARILRKISDWKQLAAEIETRRQLTRRSTSSHQLKAASTCPAPLKS